MKNMLEANIEKKNNGYIESKIYRFHGNHLSQTHAKRTTQHSRKIMVTYSHFISTKSFLNKVYTQGCCIPNQ